MDHFVINCDVCGYNGENDTNHHDRDCDYDHDVMMMITKCNYPLIIIIIIFMPVTKSHQIYDHYNMLTMMVMAMFTMVMTLNVAPGKGPHGVLLELAPTVLERFSLGHFYHLLLSS